MKAAVHELNELRIASSLHKVHALCPMAEAYELLCFNKIRHLPVVNDAGEVIGVLSDRDCLRALSPKLEMGDQNKAGLVCDYMSTTLRTISIDGSIQDVISKMLDNKISSCLVERDGEVIGIVTTEDLLRLLKTYLDNPSGSLRSRIEEMVLQSPLGEVAYFLSQTGI